MYKDKFLRKVFGKKIQKDGWLSFAKKRGDKK